MLPLSDREKRWGFSILAALLLSITLPYAWAWALTPPGFTWGGLLFSADDQNVHLMWARQAQDGAFFLRDLFTTESLTSGARPLFFNVLALLMGWMSRLTGWEVAFSYHIVRVAGAAWALWQLHLLSWSATGGAPARENARIGTLALAAFTTGVGFIGFPLLMSRIALIDRADNILGWPLMPEAFLWLSALLYPLNIVALGLLALVFRHILGGKWWPAALGALLLSNIHTYDALPLLVIAAAWALWNWKTARAQSGRALAALGGALLPVLYQLVVFRDSAEFRIKAITRTPPPPLADMLISFAPLLILAAIGWLLLREQKRARNLMALWAGVVLAMVYAPPAIFPFARKMIEGFQLPLLVLAGAGLASLKRPIMAAFIVATLALSPLITLNWILSNAAENNASRLGVLMPALYLHNSEVTAMRYLAAQKEPGAVLSLPLAGAYIPRATGKTTYFGHWAETLNPAFKRAQTLRYFSGQMAPAEARELFQHNHVGWVMEGPWERGLSASSPSRALGLREVFRIGGEAGETVIYAAQ